MNPNAMSYLLAGFSDSVARNPTVRAVVDGQVVRTRQELATHSEVLARALSLKMKGSRGHRRIALSLGKTFEAMVAILACLKARVTFIPLNDAWPREKLRRVLDIAQPSMVLCNEKGRVDVEGIEVITLEALTRESGPVEADTAQNDVAYIIFTSGSTGDPKGVAISYSALDVFAKNITDLLSLEDDAEEMACLAALSFDQSVQDWVLLFLGKGTLHLLSSTMNTLALIDYIAKSRLTYVSSVGSTFALMMEYRARINTGDLSSLKTMCSGGSALFANTARALRELVPGAAIFNLFGPTEATVYCAGMKVTSDDQLKEATVPIGEPFPRHRLLYDSGKGLQSFPDGEAEMFILGPQLMNGYLGAKSGLESIEWNGETVAAYRTGDLFIQRNNHIIFVGRKGGFVKSRGYRVSPHEIEDAFLGQQGILECAVIAVPDEVAENLIVLYYASRAPISEDALFQCAEQRLPPYATPYEFVHVESLPKSSSGKIAYGELRDQYLQAKRA